MIYLNEAPCRFRKNADPFYRCLVLKKCMIGNFDVRASLSIGFDGIFSVTHTVIEGELTGVPMQVDGSGSSTNVALNKAIVLPKLKAAPLDFTCSFTEGK